MKTNSKNTRYHCTGLALRTQVRAGGNKNIDDLFGSFGDHFLETIYTNQLNRVTSEMNRFSNYIKAFYSNNRT